MRKRIAAYITITCLIITGAVSGFFPTTAGAAPVSCVSGWWESGQAVYNCAKEGNHIWADGYNKPHVQGGYHSYTSGVLNIWHPGVAVFHTTTDPVNPGNPVWIDFYPTLSGMKIHGLTTVADGSTRFVVTYNNNESIIYIEGIVEAPYRPYMGWYSWTTIGDMTRVYIY